MSIYGVPYDAQMEQQKWKRIHAYLDAKIKAEKLNPQDDYDGTREIELLKEIAKSDLPFIMRCMLVNLLEQDTKHDDE